MPGYLTSSAHKHHCQCKDLLDLDFVLSYNQYKERLESGFASEPSRAPYGLVVPFHRALYSATLAFEHQPVMISYTDNTDTPTPHSLPGRKHLIFSLYCGTKGGLNLTKAQWKPFQHDPAAPRVSARVVVELQRLPHLACFSLLFLMIFSCNQSQAPVIERLHFEWEVVESFCKPPACSILVKIITNDYQTRRWGLCNAA